MGSFFLFAGTALFLAGLGVLLAVFVSIISRLKNQRSSSVYFKRKPSFKKSILTVVGVLLVVFAQGFYWFHSEVNKFVVFEDTIPQLRLNFVVERDRTPRVVVTSTNQNFQQSSQVIPLVGDQLYISTEVIEWKKMFRLLGLRDCYHFDGVYYDKVDSLILLHERLPDYPLNAGPTGLVSLIRTLGSVFPAEARIMVSPAVQSGPDRRYVIAVSPDSVSCIRPIDNLSAADYSN